MDVMPVNYIPGDPMLIDNIVWELKSQGIFDTFRKECIADVDTKPAYQNLRQRVEGSVSSFLRKQTWSPDLNKNQLREQLRKNIYESGYLETGVERIVDQVVNPKMNTVFLPKVTNVVYQYLGLAKPEVKSEKEKEEELKSKTKELLPKELEAVSPESRHDDKNDDSNLSLESMKIDEDESPPFEPLDEDNSIDSHMSGISGLQSHDSNSSPKALQIDDTQTSKHSSDGGAPMEIEESSNIEHPEAPPTPADSTKPIEADSSSNSSKSDLKKDFREMKIEKNDKERDNKDKERHRSESKSRSRSESKSDKNDKKYDKSKDREKDKNRVKERDRDKDHKDKGRSREKDKSKSDKDKYKDSKHSDRKSRDDRKSSSSSSSKPKDKDSHKSSSKSRDDKSRSKHDSSRDRKSSTSRSEKDKDRKHKDKKDDHYSSKHKSERRSTDRDSNDGSGLKSSSSSYCESNSSSQHSHSKEKESTNSNESGQGGGSQESNSDRHESKHRNKNHKDFKGNVVLDSEVEHSKEIEIRPKTPPSISVSAATWDALEAQLNSNISYDTCYDSDNESSDKTKQQTEDPPITEPEPFTKPQVEKTSERNHQDTEDNQPASELDNSTESNNSADTKSLQYFSQSSIETDERNLQKASYCLAKIKRQIKNVESRLSANRKANKMNDIGESKSPLKRKRDDLVESTAKKQRSSDDVGNPLPILITNNDSQNFHLPLSPAESDSDKSTDKKTDYVMPTPEAKRRVRVVNARYSSDELYKPRPVISRTTRRTGNMDT